MTLVCKTKIKFRDVLEIMQQILVLMEARSAKPQHCDGWNEKEKFF